jgi:hypothetical protein
LYAGAWRENFRCEKFEGVYSLKLYVGRCPTLASAATLNLIRERLWLAYAASCPPEAVVSL